MSAICKFDDFDLEVIKRESYSPVVIIRNRGKVWNNNLRQTG